MDKGYIKDIGMRIKKQREFLNLTQDELCDKSGVSTKFIGSIEQGKQSFSIDILIKLCEALHVSADSIIFGREKVNDIHEITQILESLDSKYIPCINEHVRAFINTISIK